MAQPICGGFSAAQTTIEPERVAEFKAFQPIIEAASGKTFATLEPVSYTSQVVAGMNYIIKYKVNPEGTEYVHAKIYVPGPWMNQPAEVSGFADGQTLESPMQF